MTTEQIKAFQQHHQDWEGKRLKADGVLGPKTRWALAISRLDPRRQEIVWNATLYVGHEEEAPNHSSRIAEWLARCGIYKPAPWCAAFASWCLSVDDLPERRIAGAQALGKSMRASTLVLPGDLMWFPTGDWEGHCGIIIGTGPGELAVVEGNQRNAVRLVVRRTSEVNIASPLPVEELPGIPPGLETVPVQREGTR